MYFAITIWKWLQRHYPAIAVHLKQFAEQAQQRCDQGEYWWELRACEYYQEFEKTKIIYLVFQVKPAFTCDETGTYGNNATWIIPGKDHYLLGVLNLKLGWFLISHYCTQIQNGYQLIFQYLGRIPVKRIDFHNPTDKAKHDRIVYLVTQILELNKRLTTALDTHSKTVLKRQIEAVDEEIDRVVYGVYNLTEEEIEMVEKS